MHEDLRWPVGGGRAEAEMVRNAVEGLRRELPYSSDFIKVSVEHGWLTLEGDVEWSYQRDRAEKAVRAVRGVIGVSDNLRRQPPVAATEVGRRIELDANRTAVNADGPGATPRGPRSWATLEGLSMHGEPVGR